MPLSEHEQRAFEALEEALHKQDPVFADRLRSKNASSGQDRRTLSVFGFVVGLALTLTFCWTTAVGVGVAGFLIMLVSLDTFWTNARNDRVRDRFRRDRWRRGT